MNTNQDTGRGIAAISLIGFGVLFLLAQVFNFSLFGLLWPFFIIGPGAAFLYFANKGDKGQAGLAVPGSIITGTGLILMYQNLTGNWISWAYMWLLYPVFLGLALQFMGRRANEENTYNVGSGFVRWGGGAFVAIAVLCELFLFHGGLLGGLGLPLVLIALGAFMLMRPGSQNSIRNFKIKNEGLFTSAHNGNGRGIYTGVGPSATIDPDLQRKINAALAEDDDQDEEKPKNG
ncbi:MAG TPA: hypothetical protein VHO69_09550 [Phototrophicaceae bacterium]|nr:hypothetical protein [Phototrophicaceae bacterium]